MSIGSNKHILAASKKEKKPTKASVETQPSSMVGSVDSRLQPYESVGSAFERNKALRKKVKIDVSMP